MISAKKKNLLSLIGLIIFTIIVTVFSIFSFDFKLESFTKSCVETDTAYVENFESKTIIQVKEKDPSGHRFKELYSAFYWSSLSNGCRELIDNKCIDSNNQEITLGVQSLFTVIEHENAGEYFYMHDGQYFTYLNEENFRSNLTRYNCDTFIFVSDLYADILLKKYGIYDENNLVECYRTLVNEEQYCVLELDIDGVGATKFCINNVITSSERQGTHMKNIHGLYAVTYFNNNFSPNLRYSFEVELKNGDYCAKKLINTVLNGGYDVDSYAYEFFQKIDDNYTSVNSLNNQFVQIASIKNKDVFKYLSVVFGLLFFIGYTYINLFIDSNKGGLTSSLLYLIQIAISVLFLLIISIFNLYYYWSVLPLVSLVIILLSSNRFKSLFIKRKGRIDETKNIEFYSIDI